MNGAVGEGRFAEGVHVRFLGHIAALNAHHSGAGLGVQGGLGLREGLFLKIGQQQV